MLRGECIKGDSQIVKRCSFGREPHTILRRVRKWNRHNVAQLPAELVQTERRRRHGPTGADIGRRWCLLFVEAVEELEAAALADQQSWQQQRQSTQEEKLVLKPCTNKYNGVSAFVLFSSAVQLKPLSEKSTLPSYMHGISYSVTKWQRCFLNRVAKRQKAAVEAAAPLLQMQ